MEKRKGFFEWLLKTQLLGAIVGGLIVVGADFTIAWKEREWSKETVAAAFTGEISTIIQFQNTKYLRGLLKSLDKEVLWKPIDQPPERLFTIYEAAAPKLGLLGPTLSEKIAKFYWLKNEERDQERVLGSQFMEFELTDKKFLLKRYIKLHETLEETGKEIIELLKEFS